MPYMNGYEATRRIKSDPNGQATVIIALTASVLEASRDSILEAGCDDFMHKPFKDTNIFDMMHKYLGVHYVYEAPSPTGKAQTERLTPARLAVLPTECLIRLSEAIDLSDPDMIRTILDDIRGDHAAVAKSLNRLVDDFEYDVILSMIEEVR